MEFEKFYDIIVEKLETWLGTLISMLPNLVVAFLLIVLFALLARFSRNIAGKIINRISGNRSLNKLFQAIIYFSILAVGVFVALDVVKLDKAVTSMLAGAGIIGLALSFAFQDVAANFMAGTILAIRRPFRNGDIIESKDYFGTVADINLRTTILRTFQGQEVMIPNKEVFQNAIINYSVSGERRIDLDVGISYGENLNQVREVTLDAVMGLDGINKARPVDLYFTAFADSSINFVVRFWISKVDQPAFLKAKSDAIMAIKAAYDSSGITIPFPIRTLDFGIKGGEKLTAMLSPVLGMKEKENGS